MTGNNGLFARAKEAREETLVAQEDELRRLTQLEAAANLENHLYIDQNGDTATIPAGFAVSQVEGENTIANGLVVIDKNGNEFVWVPVDDITKMSTTTGVTDVNLNQNYQGKLYNFTATGATEMTSYGQGTNNFREPDTVFDYDENAKYLNIIKGILTNNTADYADITAFKNTLQKDYNAMIKSVDKYGGFYVSRYEMSKSTTTNKVASVANVTPLVNDSNNRWYGLYAYGKTYDNNSVGSSIIWGSQYDAMIRWMQDNGVNVIGNIGDNKNTGTITGTKQTDVIKNIYDIYGCHREWTLEAYSTNIRVTRGGDFKYNSSPSMRNHTYPTAGDRGYSSHFTLYVK